MVQGADRVNDRTSLSKASARQRDYALWMLIVQTRDSIRKARQKELDRYSISGRQSGVLSAIHSIGPKATPAKISRWVLREPHTVSEILSRMEKRGLVTKVRDLDRKNQIRIQLTDKGRQAYRQASKRSSIASIMACLSDEEREQLVASLDKLRSEALKAMGVDAALPALQERRSIRL